MTQPTVLVNTDFLREVNESTQSISEDGPVDFFFPDLRSEEVDEQMSIPFEDEGEISKNIKEEIKTSNNIIKKKSNINFDRCYDM